jgi:hypothetical protein
VRATPATIRQLAGLSNEDATGATNVLGQHGL